MHNHCEQSANPTSTVQSSAQVCTPNVTSEQRWWILRGVEFREQPPTVVNELGAVRKDVAADAGVPIRDGFTDAPSPPIITEVERHPSGSRNARMRFYAN